MDSKTQHLLNDFAKSQPALNQPGQPASTSAVQLGDLIAAASAAAAAASTAATAATAYAAGTPSNWASTPPTTVAAALDRIAAALVALSQHP